jgi:hypothetical protein
VEQSRAEKRRGRLRLQRAHIACVLLQRPPSELTVRVLVAMVRDAGSWVDSPPTNTQTKGSTGEAGRAAMASRQAGKRRLRQAPQGMQESRAARKRAERKARKRAARWFAASVSCRQRVREEEEEVVHEYMVRRRGAARQGGSA